MEPSWETASLNDKQIHTTMDMKYWVPFDITCEHNGIFERGGTDKPSVAFYGMSSRLVTGDSSRFQGVKFRKCILPGTSQDI